MTHSGSRSLATVVLLLFVAMLTAYAVTVATLINVVTVSATPTDTNYVSAEAEIQRDSLLKIQWGGRNLGTATLSLRVVPYFGGVAGDTLRLDSITASASRYITVKMDSVMNKWFGGLTDTNNVARDIQKQMKSQWKYRAIIQKRGPVGQTPLIWANRATN